MGPGRYGGGGRLVEISTASAVGRHDGMPTVPIRWLLARDPLSRFAAVVLIQATISRPA